MMGKRSLVSVVDDDESVRESLPDLLRQFGFAAEAFSSAEAFLASDRLNETRCLILDVAMPGMSGPDLQVELKGRQKHIPIIFITAGDRSVRSPGSTLGPTMLTSGNASTRARSIVPRRCSPSGARRSRR